MHVPSQEVENYVNILGYVQVGFPQTYLGLPLSHEKLNLSVFSPLIAGADRYQSGWWASLLNHQGRLVLINSVLYNLPIYAMRALHRPQDVIDALDALQRAFLWADDNHVSGAQCLVSWDKACLSKKEGGLGVRNLRLQNTCLLLKVIHRAHDVRSSTWARWLELEFSSLLDVLESTDEGTHLATLRRLLPDYRLLTTVEVGAGRTTTFWHDCWTSTCALADAFSHSSRTCGVLKHQFTLSCLVMSLP
jgi:hypothetical protein